MKALECPVDLTFEAYLKTISSSVKRGRVKTVLETTQGFSGDYMQRKDWAFKVFQNPEVVIDEEKKRIYLSKELNFYDFSQITKIVVEYIKWLRNPKD